MLEPGKEGRRSADYSGPISKVAVLDRPVSYWNKKTTDGIDKFLTYYTRYGNAVAYGNQLLKGLITINWA